MRYAVIPAIALVLLGTFLPRAFSDDASDTYYIGANSDITTSQGLDLHLLNITDSRCPSDVKCIWAGQINATFVAQSPISKRVISLTNSAGSGLPVVFENYAIQLVDAKPYPHSGHSISLTDYILTLKVGWSGSKNTVRLVTDSKICLAGVDTCVMAKRLHLAPLKQVKVGIGALDVECKDGFGLVIKAADNMPSCVKSSTADVLVQRGWAITSDELAKLRTTYEPAG